MPRRTRGDGFEFEWRGEELLRDVEAAAEDAINETTESILEQAKQDGLEGTERRGRSLVRRLARRVGTQIVGTVEGPEGYLRGPAQAEIAKLPSRIRDHLARRTARRR